MSPEDKELHRLEQRDHVSKHSMVYVYSYYFKMGICT
jgi:hypothetical protein